MSYSFGGSAHGQAVRAPEVQPRTQVQALRAQELQPRIGVMSDEVVLQKLNSYGVQIGKFERGANKYVVHTQLEDKPVVLEIDRLTGAIHSEGKSVAHREFFRVGRRLGENQSNHAVALQILERPLFFYGEIHGRISDSYRIAQPR